MSLGVLDCFQINCEENDAVQAGNNCKLVSICQTIHQKLVIDELENVFATFLAPSSTHLAVLSRIAIVAVKKIPGAAKHKQILLYQ